MNLAGLDLSLVASGVSILTDEVGDGTVASARLCTVGHPGDAQRDPWVKRSRRVRAVGHGVLSVLDAHPGTIDHVAIEAPIYPERTMPSYVDRMGLLHLVMGGLDVREIPFTMVAVTTAKMFVTGRGNATKAEVVESAGRWYGRSVYIIDDNAADALGLAMMCAMAHDLPLPFRPRAHHHSNMRTAFGSAPKSWAAVVKARGK